MIQCDDMLPEKTALLKEIRKQEYFPTGGDPYIRAFFETLLKDTDNPLIDLIASAQKTRNRQKHYLTKSHAAYLPLHIINYIMIFMEGTQDYPYTYSPSLMTPAGWDHLIRHVLTKYGDLFQRYLLEKDVQQNIYQRSVAVVFLINTLLRGKTVKAADLGCSANFVWGSVITHTPYAPVVDHTAWKSRTGMVLQNIIAPVSVAEIHGLDHHYPIKTEEGKHWLLACRHPKEVKPEYIARTRQLIEAYEHLPHITIHEGDFVNPQLRKNYFDIVTLNNTLYQLPDRKKREAVNKALELLNKKDGLLVIQENCRVQSTHTGDRLIFTDSRKYYTYRTCIGGPVVRETFGRKWMEVLRFKTTRCLEVKPGKDFAAYMSLMP